jgi:hypothetical protein
MLFKEQKIRKALEDSENNHSSDFPEGIRSYGKLYNLFS